VSVVSFVSPNAPDLNTAGCLLPLLLSSPSGRFGTLPNPWRGSGDGNPHGSNREAISAVPNSPSSFRAYSARAN
jgi:hypothetical protein